MRKFAALFALFAFSAFPVFPVLAAESAPAIQQKAAATDNAAQSGPASPAKEPAAGTPSGVLLDTGVGATSPAAPAKPILPSVTLTPAVPAKTEPQVKIGFVDMMKIANETDPGKAAYADLKARAAKLKSRIEAKRKQMEKEKAAIESKIRTMTPEQRNAAAKGFQKKLDEFQKFVEKGQKEIAARESELLGKLYTAIEKSAGDYGKANGFAAIVTKKELLFVSESANIKDITDEIAKGVNAEQRKK